MNTAAVTHRATNEYCYAIDKDTVVVNIKTAKDVQRAFLIHEDPFIHELRRWKHWKGVRTEMTLLAELKNHLVWTIRIQPAYKRLRYYFELESDGDTFVVCENKVCPIEENSQTSMQYYKYAWINSSDMIAPPDWVKKTVWYQIMPDRFCRSCDSASDSKFRKWGDFSHPGWNDLYGGNLKGITEKLDYLQALGISGIYMTPIFQSGSNHKYNTRDYWTIDPDFGTEDDLIELVTKAHDRGIRIMLDAVFNHCGADFAPWVDVKKNGKSSPYYDWFYINSEDFAREDFSTEDGRIYSFSFWAGMPKLNTNNPQVVSYFTDVCRHWVEDWKIDGIRFDVGDEVSHTFIRKLNDTLKQNNPEIFFLGEIWTDSMPWLNGHEYDSVMNYPLPGCINDFFHNPKLTFRDFIYSLNRCRTMYPEQITKVLFNFLDTHDTPRVAEISNSVEELIQKIGIIMTLPGTPCIYYGTEIAMKGMDTPYNRSTMPWNEIESGDYDAVSSQIAALIKLRNTHKAFRSNHITYLPDKTLPRLIHYRKSDSIEVIANADKVPYQIDCKGKVLFQYGYRNGVLSENGLLIIKL